MKNDNWTLEDLVDAWEKILMASEQFGIPVSKLQGHLDDTICLRMGGRKGVLTLDEEEELVTYVINMALIGHPLVIIEVGSGGEDTKRETHFKRGIHGKSWLRCFCKGNLDLTLRIFGMRMRVALKWDEADVWFKWA